MNTPASERPTVRVPPHDITIGMAFSKGLLFKYRERAYDAPARALTQATPWPLHTEEA